MRRISYFMLYVFEVLESVATVTPYILLSNQASRYSNPGQVRIASRTGITIQKLKICE